MRSAVSGLWSEKLLSHRNSSAEVNDYPQGYCEDWGSFWLEIINPTLSHTLFASLICVKIVFQKL